MTESAMFDVLWRGVGGESTDRPAVSGPEHVLPSVYDVTGLAANSVACAALAAAEVLSARTGQPAPAVQVNRRTAALAFASEALFQPVGWSTPPIWDPIAGDYRAGDGWIRLHTNYRYHRDAVVRVLGVDGDRATVAAEVARWPAERLEAAVVEAGGCAAAGHDRDAWTDSPAGQAGTAEPIARWTTVGSDRPTPEPGLGRPYAGLRVLDLTRVIAGPVATRYLAAYGADVLRIDRPGFDEVPALLPETTVGKHCAALDLTDARDRASFDDLVARADVVVSGLRPGALAALGYDPSALRRLNPALITASHNAYGWTGPWQDRRGFDSLVQMSCGIAAAGSQESHVDRPVPLPVQALDHATGYLVAAAVGLAVRRRYTEGVATDVRLSLVGTANVLMAHPVVDGLSHPRPEPGPDDFRDCDTAWGPARQVPVPGGIHGVDPQWTVPAGPLGRHPAAWS